MLIEKYLGEQESVISKALSLPEPKVGGEYPSEKVARYIKIIDNAIKAMAKKEESDTNDAIMEDLRDKKSKWKNVDKETKPTRTKLEVPPDQEEEPPPPPEEEEPDQQKESRIRNIFNS
jgi:hypothetical protein